MSGGRTGNGDARTRPAGAHTGRTGDLPALSAPIEEALAEVLARRPADADRTDSLLDHGTIAADVHTFMREGPYECIFAEVDICAAMMALMKAVCFRG